MNISLQPVAYVHSTRAEIKDDAWDRETAYVELTADYDAESLQGLDSFSHVALIFYMHQVSRVTTGVRHPRNREDWPAVGIFAQRGKNRPNALGLTVCRIERLEGKRLYVQGLDAVDGTPVLDIKPWVDDFGPRGDVQAPAWMHELMADYWG